MPNSLSELHTLHAWEDNQITERCTQGEYAGKVLQFKLVDKDGDINLSNCLVQYAVTRPDKTEDLLDCTVDNGVVKCNLTYSATSISGLVHGEVRVIGSNNSGTIKFYGVNLRVYKGVSDEAVEQSDEFTALVAALQKVATVNPDGSNTVTLDSAIVENGTNPVASGVIYAALQVLDNAKIDKDKVVKYTGSNDLSECVDNGVLYRVHDGTTYQILLCNSGDAYRVQYMFKRSGEVVFRTSAKSNDTWGAWSTWSPIGTTSNIADGAVTTAKVADDLAAVINAKEVKSNKKTTLTGNESSNDYYPTTKAVADALNTEVGDLKSAIANIGEDIERELFPNHLNIISEFDWELESGFINTSTGEEVDNGSYVRTGFIPLPENKTYRLSDKNDNTNYRVYYYDSNKEYLSTYYNSGEIKKSGAAYVRFTRVETYSAETTLLDFMKGFYGLRKDYEAGDYNDPMIYTSKYGVVESNRLASDTIIPQDVIEKELNAGKLTTILENKNVNLLDRTKLETGYLVDGEGNIKTTTGSVRLMRAMPIKPNTQYTFSLYGGWGVANAWWLDRYAEDVISAVQGTTGSSLTVTSPSNAFFLRFTLANDANTQNVMIVEGTILPQSFVAYDPSKLKLKTQFLPDEILTTDFDVVEANKLADEVNVGQKTINELTELSRLQNLIEDNSVNLFDRSKLETGYGVNEYGNITISGVGGRVMRAMPILPNTEYTLSMFNYFGFINPCWLDSHGETVISMISGTVGSPVTVTSPVNAYFLRFGFAPASTHNLGTDKAMIVKGDSLPSDFVDYVSGLMRIKRTLLPGAKGNKDWSGKKYIAFGDSRSCGYASKTDGTVTWDDDESGKNSYPEMIGYYTGIAVDNRAVPGGAYANRTADGYYKKSLDYFTENLPTDADIITIFLGTNDRVIGSDPADLNPTEERDDVNDPFNAETFKGAIRNGLKKIRAKMPEVPIIMMVDDRGFNATAADGGTTRADMIREVAREAGLPVFDIALKGMNQDTLNDEIYNGVKNKYWYHTDTLHESILGNKMLAKALAGEMAKYLW